MNLNLNELGQDIADALDRPECGSEVAEMIMQAWSAGIKAGDADITLSVMYRHPSKADHVQIEVTTDPIRCAPSDHHWEPVYEELSLRTGLLESPVELQGPQIGMKCRNCGEDVRKDA